MIYIVMGVSGCGKSTIGDLLAKKLELPFYDADDFHSQQNIAKMQVGIPLTDEDRQEWLQQLSDALIKWEQTGGAVLACSALKERYREVLTSIPPQLITWVFLKGSISLIQQRVAERKNHFMTPMLIQSQFDALEEPAYGIHVDVDATPEKIVQQIFSDCQL
ncbi:MAG TPA: gluconokinase [Flavisolibacter sp.]|nr:gluconokinase [Flavisolibacter sp.]